MMSSTPVVMSLILGSCACDVAGQVCFKLGIGGDAAGSGPRALLGKVFASPLIGIGVAVYALEFVLWFSALSRAQLSFAFPFAALTYVGVVLASRLVLHEHVSLRRWLGIGAIVVGVALVSGRQLG
jgi:drug/metabolite transporter (DMT)-like permease